MGSEPGGTRSGGTLPAGWPDRSAQEGLAAGPVADDVDGVQVVGEARHVEQPRTPGVGHL